ncbi:MAG: peptidylprolyl isomerase [Gemmatimonadota bacterium]
MHTSPASSRHRSRVLLTLAGSLYLGACAAGSRAAGTGAVPVSADDMRDDARLLALFDTRGQDTLLIDRMLASTTPARRARGVLVVGQNAIRARYPALRRLLVDADTAVAASAAYALGLAKDSASIVALGRAFAGAPDVVAREAAWALGEIGEPSRTVILIALGDGTAQPRVSSTAAQRAPLVRAEMLLSAVKLRGVPVAAVAAWASDTADAVARAVSYTLGRPRVAAGVRVLLPLASHRDEFVRQHVARALIRDSVGDAQAAAAREALAVLLTDASPRVRANAVRSAATYGASMRAAFDKGLRDPDANVRVAATESVGAMFARDAAAWQGAWAQDTLFTVRRALLVAARRAGSDALTAGEEAWKSAPDWRYRAASFEARALAPGADRAALGRAMLADGDSHVRAAALALLPAAADDSGSRAVFRGLLGDADVFVRAGALRALARSARASEIPAALLAYNRAARDAEADARAAALRYIAAAWTRDSAAVDGATLASLRALPSSADPASRALVDRVTPLASWRAVAAEPRPLADYERIARRWLAPGARMPVAVIRTDRGDVTLQLLASDAPLVVDAFVTLAQKGFYRGSRFHRVVPNFVAQDGDPRGDGSGGPGFALRDSYTRQRHERGCLGLATSGPDTGGSQYYLCHSAQPHLDGHYTVFGTVLRGFDVMDAIVQGDRVLNVEIR